VPCVGLRSVGKGVETCDDGSIIYDRTLYEERSGALVPRGLKGLSGIDGLSPWRSVPEGVTVNMIGTDDLPYGFVGYPSSLGVWYAANPLATFFGLLGTGLGIGWLVWGRNRSGGLAGLGATGIEVALRDCENASSCQDIERCMHAVRSFIKHDTMPRGHRIAAERIAKRLERRLDEECQLF
jgi:hypothetical protein